MESYGTDRTCNIKESGSLFVKILFRKFCCFLGSIYFSWHEKSYKTKDLHFFLDGFGGWL